MYRNLLVIVPKIEVLCLETIGIETNEIIASLAKSLPGQNNQFDTVDFYNGNAEDNRVMYIM